MFWKSKALLAKIETTYGTDAAPTGAANAILAMNVNLTPMDGEDVKRDIERPQFGADPMIPAALRSQISFDVEAVGSGTLGTAPGWGPLIRACAVAQVLTATTKVEYTPVTDNPESASIYFNIDGTQHVLLGSRGTFQFKLGAQGIPMLSFTFTGLFTLPTAVAKPTVDYSAFQAPQIASAANTPLFTVGGTALVLRDFTMDAGIDVQARMLIGQETIRIVDRAESISAAVEAVALATYNPFTTAQNQTPQAIALQHGTVVGRKFRLDVAAAQQMRLSGYAENQNIVEWPLSFVPLPTAGNDQWKITLT